MSHSAEGTGSPPGQLTAEEIAATGRSLLDMQLSNGMIPWHRDGHADTWNHTEALIGLLLAGEVDGALRGFEWLRRTQNRDGSFCHLYFASGVKEPRIDLNTCLYVAVGVLGLLSFGGDVSVASRYMAMVEGAVAYVLRFQRDDGSFPWAVDPSGSPLEGSLLAGSSSMVTSFDAASRLFDKFGGPSTVPSARDGLAASLSSHGTRYSDKSDWAMDKYYPVLAGVWDSEWERRTMDQLTLRHVEWAHGVRCLASSPWVTAAESSEAAIAYLFIGNRAMAEEITRMTKRFRCADGSYLTGLSLTNGSSFPFEECSGYSSAAVLLADYVIYRSRAESLIGAIGGA